MEGLLMALLNFNKMAHEVDVTNIFQVSDMY